MSKKTAVRRRNKASDDEFDDAASTLSTPHSGETDVETDIDPVEDEVNYKIDSIHSVELQSLQDFFSKDSNMIKPKGDSMTNIVDRHAGRCYHVPDKKIDTMFYLLEKCRRAKKKVMFNELQKDPSGIMLDFDIYQDEEEDQLSNEIFHGLCNGIIKLLMKILDFKNAKKEKFFIGIIRRPNITYVDEKNAYKDGFHLILPSIKVNRAVKTLLIKKLVENEIIDQIFADVAPAKMTIKAKDGNRSYERKDFLDVNSACVPTFFIGSSTKKGSSPYQLTHMYEILVNFDTETIMVTPNTTLFKAAGFNVCHEFSLNYEKKNGVIKKITYAPNEKYAAEVYAPTKEQKQMDEKINVFGELSTNAVHDARIAEIKELLDILSPERYSDRQKWRDVVFALANTSESYKLLAEYFSRKWPKYNHAGFEEMWTSALKGPVRNRKSVTLGSIHYWAKQDNPERYEELRKKQANNVLYSMVYEPYKEGKLNHADIAEILYRLLKHKYVTDTPKGSKKRTWYEFILENDDHIDGELYKWRECRDPIPVSLERYISEVLPNLFKHTLTRIKRNCENTDNNFAKWHNKVYENFKGTTRKLGDVPFIHSCCKMAAVRFSQCGFSDVLDKDPILNGVQNGILKLGTGLNDPPRLIQGYHSYKISKFTDVPYIPFDPYDEITRKILITLRGMFPNDETDSYEFTMYFLASTLDGNPKESMIMLMVGSGSNGKSFLVELHRSAIGETYGVKMPMSFLTAKNSGPDSATPAIMQLKDARFAYYSETGKHEVLNDAKMKEVTGQENLAGRRLNENMINFKPRCHHLVLSNNDFDILSHDHGTWRRLVYNPLKIRFVDESREVIDEKNPYLRPADVAITDVWTSDPEVRGRYLGFMVWMHFWLQVRFKGKVLSMPRPHIDFETEKFRQRQDVMTQFLAQRLVKTEDATAQYSMMTEVFKYINWYQKTQGSMIPSKGLIDTFTNLSALKNHIAKNKRGTFLVGHRFLDYNEEPTAEEKYAIQDVYDLELEGSKLNIITETPEQYYERVCDEYDKYKHIFNSEPTYDPKLVASAIVETPDDIFSHTNDTLPTPIKPRSDNIIAGRIMPEGIKKIELEEITTVSSSEEFSKVILNMGLSLDDDSDCDCDDDGYVCA